MADASGQYRHGVLIGNWSEDRYGWELMQQDQQRGLPDHKNAFVSVARLSFHGKDGGAIGEYFTSKARPPPVTLHEVEKKVLFEHSGAPTVASQYSTTYNSTWGPSSEQSVMRTANLAGVGDRALPIPLDPSLSGTLAQRKAAAAAEELASGSRDHPYRYATSHSVAYHTGNSVMATGEAGAQFTRKSAGLGKGLQASRALNLRS